MKRPVLPLFVGTLALLTTSGCATTASPRSVTATLAAERGAPVALVTSLQRGRRLALADIETLASLQVPDDTTLDYLRQNGAAYELTLAQIDQMRDMGVSPRVIDYLLATPARAARTMRAGGTGGAGPRRRGARLGGPDTRSAASARPTTTGALKPTAGPGDGRESGGPGPPSATAGSCG